MKAYPIFETWLFDWLFYKGHVKTLVKMPNGRIHTHYFRINKDNQLIVNKGKGREQLRNPKLGGMPLLDNKGKYFAMWEFGTSNAYPVFSRKPLEQKANTDDAVQRGFNLGEEFNQLMSSTKEKTGLGLDPILILGIVSVVLSAAAIFFIFSLANCGQLPCSLFG